MVILWLLLVVAHALGCIGLLVCGLMMPVICTLKLGWWSIVLWLPLGTLLVQMVSSLIARCVLTDLENRMRRKLGWQPIDGFVRHYFLDPCRVKKKRKRP